MPHRKDGPNFYGEQYMLAIVWMMLNLFTGLGLFITGVGYFHDVNAVLAMSVGTERVVHAIIFVIYPDGRRSHKELHVLLLWMMIWELVLLHAVVSFLAELAWMYLLNLPFELIERFPNRLLEVPPDDWHTS